MPLISILLFAYITLILQWKRLNIQIQRLIGFILGLITSTDYKKSIKVISNIEIRNSIEVQKVKYLIGKRDLNRAII